MCNLIFYSTDLYIDRLETIQRMTSRSSGTILTECDSTDLLKLVNEILEEFKKGVNKPNGTYNYYIIVVHLSFQIIEGKNKFWFLADIYMTYIHTLKL